MMSVATPSMMPRKENPALTEMNPSCRRARRYRSDSSHSKGAKGCVPLGSLIGSVPRAVTVRTWRAFVWRDSGRFTPSYRWVRRSDRGAPRGDGRSTLREQRYSEAALPCFADHVDAPCAVPPGAHQLESGLSIDLARARQNLLRPQGHRFIPGSPGELQALFHELATNTKPARLRFHDQQPELGDLLGGSHHESRSYRLTCELGDEAALAPAIVAPRERATVSATSASKRKPQPYSSA